MSIRPELLSKKDKVAIVATARKINLPEIDYAIKLFSLWGLEVLVGKTIGLESNQFAGNDIQRAEEIQRFLDDKDIKAIFCARGGYGSVRIIDKLDFREFLKHPKWIIGYSDPTVLLMHIYFNFNIETIHGIMPFNINEVSSQSLATKSLKECLFEKTNIREYPSDSFNCQGKAKGDLIGGNLSILYSLMGSESFGDTEGKILFIEDLDEYLYHIDRMMQALKRSGKLSKLKGLLVGAMTKMHDNAIPFGKSAYEIVAEAVESYDYPKVFDIPVGHIGKENTQIGRASCRER